MRRPRSHVLGDLAVSRVTAICSELGWVCESIQKDYGEDLWIQTTIGDKVDHHRLWFQVKGTDRISKYERRDGKLVFRVDVNHALRWVRSLDLVVFVLWDAKNDIGYWIIPEDNVTDVDLISSSRKSVQLVLDKEYEFTSEAAKKISWVARFAHYETLIRIERQNLDQSADCREIVGGYDPQFSERRIGLICYDFLHTIGFLENNGLGESIPKQLFERMNELLAKEPRASDKTLVGGAATLVILAQVEERTGCGLPGLLLLECTRTAGSLVLHILTKNGLFDLRRVLRTFE